jgi:hypothetical protein
LEERGRERVNRDIIVERIREKEIVKYYIFVAVYHKLALISPSLYVPAVLQGVIRSSVTFLNL